MLADGAHNPDGVRVLAQSLAAVARAAAGRRRARHHARQGLPGDDRAASCRCSTRVVCTQASEPRSLTRRGARRGGPARPRRARPGPRRAVEAVADPHAALARARELAGADGSVLVGGSLYLLEDLRDVLAGGR